MRRRIGTLAFILLAGVAGKARASEFTEGFETYAAGTSVHGQGGWKGWDNVAAAGAPVSNRVAHGGRNSIEIVGSSDLVHEFRLTGGNAEDYVVDLQRSVSGIAGPNLSNQGLGTAFYYSFLTASSVNISAPYSAVDLVTSVRLRIWVYDRPAETP